MNEKTNKHFLMKQYCFSVLMTLKFRICLNPYYHPKCNSVIFNLNQ